MAIPQSIVSGLVDIAVELIDATTSGAGSIASGIATGAGSIVGSGIGGLIGGIALIVALREVDRRSGVEVPTPIMVIAIGLVLFWSLGIMGVDVETALVDGLAEVSPLIWLGLIGGALASVIVWIRSRRGPDYEITIPDN